MVEWLARSAWRRLLIVHWENLHTLPLLDVRLDLSFWTLSSWASYPFSFSFPLRRSHAPILCAPLLCCSLFCSFVSRICSSSGFPHQVAAQLVHACLVLLCSHSPHRFLAVGSLHIVLLMSKLVFHTVRWECGVPPFSPLCPCWQTEARTSFSSRSVVPPCLSLLLGCSFFRMTTTRCCYFPCISISFPLCPECPFQTCLQHVHTFLSYSSTWRTGASGNICDVWISWVVWITGFSTIFSTIVNCKSSTAFSTTYKCAACTICATSKMHMTCPHNCPKKYHTCHGSSAQWRCATAPQTGIPTTLSTTCNWSTSSGIGDSSGPDVPQPETCLQPCPITAIVEEPRFPLTTCTVVTCLGCTT